MVDSKPKPPPPRLCPGGCGKFVVGANIACPKSWYHVPRVKRVRIWHLYHNDRGSARHVQEVAEAVRMIRDDAVCNLQNR